jgi:hypothetical protein
VEVVLEAPQVQGEGFVEDAEGGQGLLESFDGLGGGLEDGVEVIGGGVVGREQVEDIDPSWCPAWPVEWQRAFHLVRQHLDAGGTLPTAPGQAVHQGEDLGRWVRAQRLGWDRLTGAQQWMCENVLGIDPAAQDEKPKPRRKHADKWALNYIAARQYYEREGHLQVPRGHVERIATGDDDQGQEERDLKLGSWISNQRSRAATLPPERVQQLSEIGMRWP